MVNMYGAGKAYNLQFRQRSFFPQQTMRVSTPAYQSCFCSSMPTVTVNTTPGGFFGFMMGLNAGFSVGNMAMSSIGSFACSVGNLIGNNKVGNAFVRTGMGMGGGFGMSCPGFGGYGMTFPALGGFGNCYPCFGSMGMSYPCFGSMMGMGYPSLSGGLYSGFGYSPLTMQSTREGQGAAEVAQQKQDSENLARLNGLYSSHGYKIVPEGDGKFSATDKNGKLVAKNLTYEQARDSLGSVTQTDEEDGADAARTTGTAATSTAKPAATKYTISDSSKIVVTTTSLSNGKIKVTGTYSEPSKGTVTAEFELDSNDNTSLAQQQERLKPLLEAKEIPTTTS